MRGIYIDVAAFFVMVAALFFAVRAYYFSLEARWMVDRAKAECRTAEAYAVQAKINLEHCEAHKDDD